VQTVCSVAAGSESEGQVRVLHEDGTVEVEDGSSSSSSWEDSSMSSSEEVCP
jgi:hypothetical protein